MHQEMIRKMLWGQSHYRIAWDAFKDYRSPGWFVVTQLYEAKRFLEEAHTFTKNPTYQRWIEGCIDFIQEEMNRLVDLSRTNYQMKKADPLTYSRLYLNTFYKEGGFA